MAKLHAVMLCNRIRQRSGYQAHHRHGLSGHGSLLNSSCADVIQKQYAHLITGNQLIAAVRALHGDTDTVCIRVGGKHQICLRRLGKLQTILKRLKDLRIRVRAGGEVTAGIFLLGNDGHVRNAHV